MTPSERDQTELTFAHVPSVALRALDEALSRIPVGMTLTAESIRDRVSPAVLDVLRVNGNAIGAWFRAKAKAGQLTPDGFTAAQRDDARGRALRRWRRAA